MKGCKWCNQQHHKLIDSHIIPRAFFNYKAGNDQFIMSQKTHKKRRRIGSYDSEIICDKCERDYSIIDADAADILLNNFERYTVPFNDIRDRYAFQVDGKHRNKIKRFLIYTLWKASVSNLPEFERVSLGPYEDKIREDLIQNKPFSTNCYSVAAYKVANTVGHLMPYKDKKENWAGLTYYVMDFGGFVFNVKVDKRPAQSPWSTMEEHLHMPFIKFDETPKNRRDAIATIVKAHEKMFGVYKRPDPTLVT